VRDPSRNSPAVKIAAWVATESWFRPPTAIWPKRAAGRHFERAMVAKTRRPTEAWRRRPTQGRRQNPGCRSGRKRVRRSLPRGTAGRWFWRAVQRHRFGPAGIVGETPATDSKRTISCYRKIIEEGWFYYPGVARDAGSSKRGNFPISCHGQLMGGGYVIFRALRCLAGNGQRNVGDPSCTSGFCGGRCRLGLTRSSLAWGSRAGRLLHRSGLLRLALAAGLLCRYPVYSRRPGLAEHSTASCDGTCIALF
jgi:hypothetical protein